MRIIVAALALSACAAPLTVCPPLRTYDDAFNARLADEIEAAPVDATWPTAIIDYVNLRDQIRAACGNG